MKAKILGAAALIGALAAFGAGSAAAAPTAKLDSQVTGNVRIDPNDPTVGYVTARYICQGGDGAHVWVSVKQAESRRPESWLTKEGSGAARATWSHSHANTVTCDGHWNVQTFRIDQSEWGWGQMKPGQAWVQFCVIPPGGDPHGARSPGTAGSRRSSSTPATATSSPASTRLLVAPADDSAVPTLTCGSLPGKVAPDEIVRRLTMADQGGGPDAFAARGSLGSRMT
jgi:hypothetical protein